MYSTEEKIAYFKGEKIPNQQAQIDALLQLYDNDDTKATAESWQYRKAKEGLAYSQKRLAELQAEQAFVEAVGNKPSTTLEIDKELLLQICADKMIDFEVAETPYLNTKFKTGKAQFESITLSCYGLTLRCTIDSPTIKRDKANKVYRISFETKAYKASSVTERTIQKLKKTPLQSA
jgi:hypothetical protein